MGKILPFAAAAAGFALAIPTGGLSLGATAGWGAALSGAAQGFSLGNLISGGQSQKSAPRAAPASAPANSVTQAPVDALTSRQKETAIASVSNNFDTQGGQQGEELDSADVKKRASLFGN